MIAKLALNVLMLAGLTAATAPDRYAQGQVWEYHTRAGDEGSLLRIQKIEEFRTGDTASAGAELVYHISVVGVHLGAGGPVTVLQHLPVSRQTLDASTTRVVTSAAAFPDASEGIAQWRAAKGGIFAIPLDQIVESVITMASQRPTQ